MPVITTYRQHLRKQWLKSAQYAPLNEVTDVSGAPGHIHLPDARDLRLINNYLQGWMRVKLVGRILAPEVEPRYFIAIFERLRIKLATRRSDTLRQPPIHPANVEHADHDKQEPMLVDIAQQLKKPERVTLDASDPVPFRVAPVVRLAFVENREDSAICDLRHELSQAHSLTVLVTERLKDGKLRLLVRRPTVMLNKLPGEMIKGGAELVENLSEQDRPFRIDGGDVADLQHVALALSIELTDKLTISVEGFSKGILQLDEMGLGATEF
ncbi:MAG TPA: hypothetical protein VKU89_00945 [Solirubrobacteraceae bacterium]|nr:hypothetical protein [Solirubrobacteraceae bacterium]